LGFANLPTESGSTKMSGHEPARKEGEMIASIVIPGIVVLILVIVLVVFLIRRV